MKLIEHKKPTNARIQVEDYHALVDLSENLKTYLFSQGEVLEDISFETKACLYHDMKTNSFQLETVDCLGEEPLEIWMITAHPIGEENNKIVYTENEMAKLFPKLQDMEKHQVKIRR